MSTPCKRVFDMPELLELILLHFDLLEIYRLQAIDSRFQSCIRNAPLMKRKTFRTQPKTLSGDWPLFVDDTFCGRSLGTAARGDQDHAADANIVGLTPLHGPAPGRALTRPAADSPYKVPDVVLSMQHLAGNGIAHIDGRLFNPHLERIFSGLRIQHLEYGWTLVTVANLPPVPKSARDQPSWREMLLTALPLKELQLEPAALLLPYREVSTHMTPPGSNWLPAPSAAEEQRIAALYSRLSTNLARASTAGRAHQVNRMHRPIEIDRRRYGDEGNPAPAPSSPYKAMRWAAARGEASSEGWVWGSSLQFAGGKKPFPGYATRLERREGITVGQLEEEMRGSKWLLWVIRRVP